MTQTNSGKSFDAARKLGFFTTTQLKTIELECQQSNSSALQVAIEKSFLNGQQIEILKSFSAPEDVAPGYRIDGVVGQGGAGVVYKATQLRLKRTVAIKTISQSQLSRNKLAGKRFEREAHIVGQLRHPNIVSAFDFGIHKRNLFLVMEFVKGIDGEKYLSQKKTLPERDVWHIALQVCHALHYSNQNGVIHRDIKPGNLILTSPPNGSQLPPQVPFVKIADFGLARFQDTPTAENITMDNLIGGTPFYMSSEQVTSGSINHQSDIYSLGVTLWHLITGTPPITGTGPLDIISTKMKLEDQWLNEIPQGMSSAGFDVLKQMCRHHPSERIGDYPKLISQIQQIIHGFEQQANSDTTDFRVDDEFSLSDEDVFQVSSQVTFVCELDDFDLFEDGHGKTNTHRDSAGDTDKLSPDSVSALSPRTPTKRTWLSNSAFFLLVIAVIGLGATAIFRGLSQPFSKPVKQDTVNAHPVVDLMDKVRLEEFEGPPNFLFDGQSFDPSQKSSGKWDVAKGEEGESVLAGNGGYRNFKCEDSNGQPLNHFAFTCGFRHHEAEQLEYRLLDAKGETEFMVSISPSSYTLLSGQTERNTRKLDVFDAESFGYHIIQIESQPDYWLVAVDAHVLGRIAKVKKEKQESTVQLVVNGQGWAHFEQIRLRRFAAPDAETTNPDTN